MNNELIILVTNDDGVHANGIAALTEVAAEFGKVIVVAPTEGQSGMAHAITVKTPIRVNKIHNNNNVTIYACSGTPVDCVKMALNKLVPQKPHLLLSGINHGANSSTSVVYSGTMSAAIEGCINDIPSIGFSMLDHSKNANFSHAKQYVRKIIENTLINGLVKGVCLNVNIPNLNASEIKGIKVCRQNRGVWREEFDHRTDPTGYDYFWLTGTFQDLEPHAEDTDEWALRNNYVSVVPVQFDLTAYNYLEKLKSIY